MMLIQEHVVHPVHSSSGKTDSVAKHIVSFEGVILDSSLLLRFINICT